MKYYDLLAKEKTKQLKQQFNNIFSQIQKDLQEY